MAYRRINSWPPRNRLDYSNSLPLLRLAAYALNSNESAQQTYQPKSLFQITCTSIWSHKSFSKCKCFATQFSCVFCYKALLTMHDEQMSLSDIMYNSNENLVVDYYKCNPTKLHNSSYVSKFERVTLMTNDVYVLKKFIVLHCLYQNGIKARICLPIYFYGLNYYFYTNDVKIGRYLTCDNFINNILEILLKRDPDTKMKIVAFKSDKTKGQILNYATMDVNIVILLLVLIFVTLIFVSIVVIIDSYVNLGFQ